MATLTYTYESTWRDAQKVSWRVEDLIGPDKPLNFHRPFLPESITRVEDLDCLKSEEKLLLNQIRGNSYIHLFVLVEAFIIPMVMEQVKRAGYGNIFATQALLGFAEEEGKHIHLFHRFAEAFEQGFGYHCNCVGPVEEVAAQILQAPPLSVLLLTLQFEWTTQIHYLESIRHAREEDGLAGEVPLDERFCDLLKFHWMEEAQHTKLDALLAHELVEQMPKTDVEAAIQGYFHLVDLFEQVLMEQVKLDGVSLERSLNRPLSTIEKTTIRVCQEQAYRWAFLCAGITHPNFIRLLDEISPTAKEQALNLAKAMSY